LISFEIVEHKLNGFSIVIGNYNVITLSSVCHIELMTYSCII